MQQNNKLAILAGNGEITSILAESAKEQGFATTAIAITEEAKHRLDGLCDRVYRFSPGQVSKILKCLREELISQVVFIGKIPKIDFLKNLHKLDFLAIRNLRRFRNFNDDSFHKAVIEFLKEHGIKVLPQTNFLKNLFLEKEILSRRSPTLEERIDIDYGFNVAKKIANLDIGQTVVVKNKMILAIEAIEGTDEAIKRGCSLAKGEVVVVKVAKPDHDERFDIPTIGELTIRVIAKSGGGILAFEADKTIVLNREELIKTVNNYNICLIAI